MVRHRLDRRASPQTHSRLWCASRLALRCWRPCRQTRWIEQLALEDVESVRLQMIEHVLEIIDVPLRRKFQGVDGFQKNPLCMRGDGRDACPRRVNRQSKDLTVTLVSKQMDDHRPAPSQHP